MHPSARLMYFEGETRANKASGFESLSPRRKRPTLVCSGAQAGQGLGHPEGYQGPLRPSQAARPALVWDLDERGVEESGGYSSSWEGHAGGPHFSSHTGRPPPLWHSSSSSLIVHPTVALPDAIFAGIKMGGLLFCGGLGTLIADDRVDLAKTMSML